MNPYEPPKAKSNKKQQIIDWEGLIIVFCVLFLTPLIYFLIVGVMVETIRSWN